jgi:hypothetical protein
MQKLTNYELGNPHERAINSVFPPSFLQVDAPEKYEQELHLARQQGNPPSEIKLDLRSIEENYRSFVPTSTASSAV